VLLTAAIRAARPKQDSNFGFAHESSQGVGSSAQLPTTSPF